MDASVFIQLKNVSKTFPGVKALEGMNFCIRKGEVHALVGENGAGKSTLIKILSGTLQPDEGSEIFIDGELCGKLNPLESMKKGIIAIFQDFSLFPNLTVAENIGMTMQVSNKEKLVDWKKIAKAAQDALAALGVDIDVNTKLENLSTARQQLVAIARALACNARLIIMDEPTSTLSASEVELLFSIIESLKKRGIAVLFVSHKLEELFRVSSIFTVIRDGKYIGTYEAQDMDNDKLISLMVGRKIEFTRQAARHIGETVLEVKGLSKKGCFKDISFKLRKGEILGISGLVGAGRTETIQALCGLIIPDEGDIFIEGKKVSLRSTEDMSKNGISYVPENRLTEGLILNQSVADNITVTILGKLINKLHIINLKKKKQEAAKWIEELNIKPGYPDMLAGKLSGGNQQRIVIAKGLATQPKILIVDEPTNGIDIGAKNEIHKLLRELADKGMCIIIVSSELAEVLSISDTILTMRRGRISGIFNGDNATQESLLNAALLGEYVH